MVSNSSVYKRASCEKLCNFKAVILKIYELSNLLNISTLILHRSVYHLLFKLSSLRFVRYTLVTLLFVLYVKLLVIFNRRTKNLIIHGICIV